MNVYIIVEGNRTEYKVYPKWLQHIAPHLKKVDYPSELRENNYYIFRGGGIPSIYNHVANAAADIVRINSEGETKIDYLMVCIDTEDESREYIIEQIQNQCKERGVNLDSINLKVFEQKVSMESWFLGNRKIFKSNPEDKDLVRYINHYNVKDNDPELMEIADNYDFSTKAQFHHSYLKKLFSEQHLSYSKTNPGEVCKEYYLNQIIKRNSETGHISSFGRWYSFVIDNLT